MADASVLAIVVPGVVTPAVVAGFAYFQQRSARLQAAADELRATIDDAAKQLGDGQARLSRLNRAWRRSEPIEDVRADMLDALRDVRIASDRLVIRLRREHRVAESYRAVAIALQDASLFHFNTSVSRSARERASGMIQDIKDGRDAFLAAAQKVVGHDLSRF